MSFSCLQSAIQAAAPARAAMSPNASSAAVAPHEIKFGANSGVCITGCTAGPAAQNITNEVMLANAQSQQAGTQR